MFEFSSEPIDVTSLRARLEDGRAGALGIFEGRVRDHNDGRSVTLLEYEAYEQLACKEAARILEEARERFGLYDCICVHRTGSLAIGDVAVWVGVISAHRGEAFEACRYVIDEIKHRLPIWKKETYKSGDSGWVNCQSHSQPAQVEGSANSHSHGDSHALPVKGTRSAPHIDENQFYERQLKLPSIGVEGQAKLCSARVLVVGAGGLGSSALLYLAAAGVGTIGICEPDKVEASNLHRQILFGAGDIGRSKVDVALGKLSSCNPFVKVTDHKQLLDRANAGNLIAEYDFVLDCTDNFSAKFALNDACVTARKTLLTASVYQFEGQLSMITADGAGQCLRCLWPKVPESDCVRSCADAGILGAVVGVFGSMQAAEAIKVICGLPTSLRDHIAIFDVLSWQSRLIRSKRSENCSICGSGEPLEESMDDNSKLNILDLSSSELAGFEVVDIREPDEEPAKHLWSLLRCNVKSMPLSQFDQEKPLLDESKKYLFVCQKGMRSGRLVEKLRERGFPNTYSLEGGVEALRRKFIA